MTASAFDISGKVAIVTGAGRGIGRGIALAYGKAGAHVAVASRTQSTVDEVVDEIQRGGGTAVGIQCDVGQRDQVFRMVDRAAETFGTVNILVNNAQAFGPSKAPTSFLPQIALEDSDEDAWEHIYRTGLLATLWGMKAAFPHMKTRGGKIINLASMSGQVGMQGFAAYNATKEGVRALSRTAAREWGKYNINVNVINPALRSDALNDLERAEPELMKANIASIPLGRVGEPLEDGGPVAVFLASRASDYITGMTFMVDGGLYISP